MWGTIGATGSRQRQRLVWKVPSASHPGGAYVVRRDAREVVQAYSAGARGDSHGGGMIGAKE